MGNTSPSLAVFLLVLSVNAPSATPTTDTVTVYLSPEAKPVNSAKSGWFRGTVISSAAPASLDKSTMYGLVVPSTSPQVTTMEFMVTLLRMTSAGTAATINTQRNNIIYFILFIHLLLQVVEPKSLFQKE